MCGKRDWERSGCVWVCIGERDMCAYEGVRE